jgi:hypothetical protein
MVERWTRDVRRPSGQDPEVPVLAIELTSRMVSGEGIARRNRLFQRALSSGIAMFDLTSSATPVLDAHQIAELNRDFHRPLTLIAPLREEGRATPERVTRSAGRESTPSEPTPLSQPNFLREIGAAAGPGGRLWVEIPPEISEDSSRWGLLAEFPNMSEEADASWVVRWDSPAQLDLVLQRARQLRGAMVSGPASLLDPRGPAALAAVAPPGARSYLARDPFAGGRLDGSLLEVGNLDRAPTEGPWSIERLQEEYRPVLAFGFLAKRGVRNLRVAALQYLLTLPSMAGIVIPISTERQLDELEGLPSAPPLEASDLERIAQLQSGRRTS